MFHNPRKRKLDDYSDSDSASTPIARSIYSTEPKSVDSKSAESKSSRREELDLNFLIQYAALSREARGTEYVGFVIYHEFNAALKAAYAKLKELRSRSQGSMNIIDILRKEKVYRSISFSTTPKCWQDVETFLKKKVAPKACKFGEDIANKIIGKILAFPIDDFLDNFESNCEKNGECKFIVSKEMYKDACKPHTRVTNRQTFILVRIPYEKYEEIVGVDTDVPVVELKDVDIASFTSAIDTDEAMNKYLESVARPRLMVKPQAKKRMRRDKNERKIKIASNIPRTQLIPATEEQINNAKVLYILQDEVKNRNPKMYVLRVETMEKQVVDQKNRGKLINPFDDELV